MKSSEKPVVAAPVAPVIPVVSSDTNDYKELYGSLRNVVNSSIEQYKASLTQIKDAIIAREEELKILKIKQHKFEGAIEASESFIKAALPNNNKR